MLTDGPSAGKIAAIVNVIDQNRVLIDGPTSGVLRQAYPIKKLQLTPIAVKFPFNARTKVVRTELEANKVRTTRTYWRERAVLLKYGISKKLCCVLYCGCFLG